MNHFLENIVIVLCTYTKEIFELIHYKIFENMSPSVE